MRNWIDNDDFMLEPVSVAKMDELKEGKGKHVSVNGLEIAIFKIGDKVYAIQQECPHQGGPLAEGDLNGFEVTCPWHQMIYDVRSGKASPKAWDKDFSVKTFKVTVVGNDVMVDIR
jgi:nitrite reductase/ring-hydroxylating ferredoxin subunit